MPGLYYVVIAFYLTCTILVAWVVDLLVPWGLNYFLLLEMVCKTLGILCIWIEWVVILPSLQFFFWFCFMCAVTWSSYGCTGKVSWSPAQEEQRFAICFLFSYSYHLWILVRCHLWNIFLSTLVIYPAGSNIIECMTCILHCYKTIQG